MASRSVTCVVDNRSKYKLTISQVKLDAGQWTQDLPNGPTLKTDIDPKGVLAWKSEGDGTVNGEVLFAVEDGSSFGVLWHNPPSGDPKYYQVHVVGTDEEQVESKSGEVTGAGGSVEVVGGDNVRARFTFQPALDGKCTAPSSVPPPPSAGGTMNAQAACGQTTHLSPPAGSKDVMLIPERSSIPAGAYSATVLQTNWQWAQQWMKADPEHRTVLEVKVNGEWGSFEDAMIKAAGIAKGRMVILFTGHGGAPDPNDLDDNVNLDTEFDTVPEGAGFSKHLHKVRKANTSQIYLAARVYSQATDGSFALRGNSYTISSTHDVRQYASLLRIGRAMKQNGVAGFMGLSCSIGRDTDFVQLMANVLQTSTTVYAGVVATAESEDHAKKVMIWVAKNHKKAEVARTRPSPKDGNDDVFHEIPSDYQRGPVTPSVTVDYVDASPYP